MNEVIIGFYKQAEELGYSPVATEAMLSQLNKVAEAAHAYVEEAANASNNPVLFKQALVKELLEKQAEGGGILDSIMQNEQVKNLLGALQQGGAGGGIVGGLGGGALGLILSLLTGSNPLAGLLAGGGLGAGAGYFGRDIYDKFKGEQAAPEQAAPEQAAVAPTASAAPETPTEPQIEPGPVTAVPTSRPGSRVPASGLGTPQGRGSDILRTPAEPEQPQAPLPQRIPINQRQPQAGGMAQQSLHKIEQPQQSQQHSIGGGLNEQQWGDKLQGFQKNVIDPAQSQQGGFGLPNMQKTLNNVPNLRQQGGFQHNPVQVNPAIRTNGAFPRIS